jgi:hypothetical protein
MKFSKFDYEKFTTLVTRDHISFGLFNEGKILMFISYVGCNSTRSEVFNNRECFCHNRETIEKIAQKYQEITSLVVKWDEIVDYMIKDFDNECLGKNLTNRNEGDYIRWIID